MRGREKRKSTTQRNLWRAHVFPKWSPLTVAQKPVHEGSRDPAPTAPGRGSRFATTHDFASGDLLPPSPPAEKATALALAA